MQGRMTPRLIGFLSEVEREFFELFCSVDGVGVKKALRAMVRPVQEVATAIEEQDAKTLSSLPGVGPATAERIIAKLRRKVPKFALMVARDEAYETPRSSPTWSAETFEVLRRLGHTESDARRLLGRGPGDKEEIQRRAGAAAGDLSAAARRGVGIRVARPEERRAWLIDFPRPSFLRACHPRLGFCRVWRLWYTSGKAQDEQCAIGRLAHRPSPNPSLAERGVELDDQSRGHASLADP